MDNSKEYRLLAFIAFIYPFFPLIKEWSTSLGNVLELGILFILLITTIVTFNNGRIALKIPVIHLLFLIYLAVYILLSPEIMDSFSAFRIFLLYILLYTALTQIKDKRHLRYIANAIVISALIMTIGALIQFPFPNVIKAFHNPSGWYDLGAKTNFIPLHVYNRSVSFFNDPNVLGVYISSVLIFMFEVNKNMKIKHIKLISLMMTVAIILSQSRTAIFILITYCLLKLVVWLLNNRKINVLYLIITIIVSLTIIFLLCKNINAILEYLRVGTLMDGNGRVPRNKLYIQNLSAQDMKALLWGNGLTVGRDGMVFENIYLMFFYSFGFIGSTILLIFLIMSFRKFFILSNVIPMTCFLIINYVGDYFYIPQISLIFLFIFAFNFVLSKKLQTKINEK